MTQMKDEEKSATSGVMNQRTDEEGLRQAGDLQKPKVSFKDTPICMFDENYRS